MLNLLDHLLGLTAKVLGYLLDWPFLLFVFLVWLASRYRDQIGSVLDRRGSVKRTELASAIRDELEPITKDIAELKPDVSHLRTKVTKIEAQQSQYASEELLKPVEVRLRTVEDDVHKIRAQFEQIAPVDYRNEITKQLAPVNQELDELRASLDQLAQDTRSLNVDVANVKQKLNEINEHYEPVGKKLENFEISLKQLESKIGETASEDRVLNQHKEIGHRSKEPARVTVSAALSKSIGGKSAQAKPTPTRSAQRQRNAKQRKKDEAIPLKVMKDELASSRWEWRRVKKLANVAGLTEDSALKMLERDPDFVVKKDNWGRRVAKLVKK